VGELTKPKKTSRNFAVKVVRTKTEGEENTKLKCYSLMIDTMAKNLRILKDSLILIVV
jgi:hypothetical protein